jgi:hypothetical protein
MLCTKWHTSLVHPFEKVFGQLDHFVLPGGATCPLPLQKKSVTILHPEPFASFQSLVAACLWHACQTLESFLHKHL